MTRLLAAQHDAWTGLECLGEQGAKPQGVWKVSAEGCRTHLLGNEVPPLSTKFTATKASAVQAERRLLKASFTSNRGDTPPRQSSKEIRTQITQRPYTRKEKRGKEAPVQATLW